MALDLLEQIRKEEEKVAQLRDSAQRDGRRILQEAETDCAAHRQAAAEKNREIRRRVLEEKRMEVSAALSLMAGERESVRLALQSQAGKKLEETARMIAEKVLSDGAG